MLSSKTKTPVILMRLSLAEKGECEIAKKHFSVFPIRGKVPPNSLVVARYSAIPWYKELADDLAINGSELINSPSQHRWIADLREWYQDFEGLTPKTWFSLEDVPTSGGPFVLKGATNSKKFQWDTHMFAKNKTEAVSVHTRLCQDGYVGDQDIYIREYVPLKNLTTGLHGLPISEEYRLFVLDGEILCSGFYWSSHVDDLEGIIPNTENIPKEFLKKVLSRVGNKARFLVIDIARCADETWTVIELNDAQCSGLSENNPDDLYSALAKRLIAV